VNRVKTLRVHAVKVQLFCPNGKTIGNFMALTTEPGLRQASSAYRDLPFEDMLDVLDMYDPASTPLFTMARREKELGNTEFWHEVDSWNPPQGAIGTGDNYPLQAGTEVMDVIANRRKIGNGGHRPGLSQNRQRARNGDAQAEHRVHDGQFRSDVQRGSGRCHWRSGRGHQEPCGP
jgi:hypothetical protein